MKRTVALLFAVVIGVVIGRGSKIDTVYAQMNSPDYTCQTGNDGMTQASPCAEYIVLVNTSRSTGRGFNVYQINSNPVDIRTLDFTEVAASTLSGLSVQAFQPGSTVNTFTLSLGTP